MVKGQYLHTFLRCDLNDEFMYSRSRTDACIFEKIRCKIVTAIFIERLIS
jgi:hypothetical protein